jgi:MFS superfamily sulfate permease-like transporter
MSQKKLNLFAHLRADFPAGLVVSLVALPLCLGIALASTGRPDLLFSGIIAGVIGGVVVGMLSGSSLGVAGPAAGLVVIVFTAIETLGSFEAFLLSVFLAGIIQIVAGLLRAGIIGYYFPSSVIKGMLTAIGITLLLKEIPHAFGYDEDFMGDFAFEQGDGHNTFSELYYAVRYSSTGAIIISIVSIALLILFERPFMKKFHLFKFLPGALVVVLLGIGLNAFFASSFPDLVMSGKHLVQLPVASSISDFFSFFKFPDFSAITNPQVYIVAFTLAIVASLETLLCVEATDKLDPHKRNTPTNRELTAQGVGNMLSGLIGGLPITQVVVRSSANINSGGQTKLATIVHGVILLLSAIFIPVYMNYIPLATLAAILLMVGYKLAKPSLFKGMYQLGWDQFIPFIITVIAILATDLLKGIMVGMVVAIYYILRKNYKHSYSYKEERSATGDKITITLSEEVTFLNKGSIQHTLIHLPANSTVIIDGSKSRNIDFDVLEIIQDFERFTAIDKQIKVQTIGIRDVATMDSH